MNDLDGSLVDIADIVDSVSVEIRVASVAQSVTIGVELERIGPGVCRYTGAVCRFG